MKLDQALVDAAITFIKSRYLDTYDGAGAAAMYTDKGNILISTYVETPNPATNLCHEAGAICEAHKLNEKVTASVCVGRTPDGRFDIITPCGVCQERLFYWGGDVQVAVPHPDNTSKWIARKLSDVQPYYWMNPYRK